MFASRGAARLIFRKQFSFDHHHTTYQQLRSSPQKCRTFATEIHHAVIFHPDFALNPIPFGHRFPMPKDKLLYARLNELGIATRTYRPQLPDLDTIALVHDKDYAQSFIDGTISPQQMKRIGLPWSERLVTRALIGVGSAILAARVAHQTGIACMSNGGTHHAHANYGSGWCVFNDLAVAARCLQRDTDVKKILFVDLDVHAGDGTASIFAHDPSIYTLSLHCEAQAFPIMHTPSDRDVLLPAGCTDEQYLNMLYDVLPEVLDTFQPEIVLYNAGTDVHKDDSLGKMALTNDGIYKRDMFVFSSCLERGVPVAAAIGGGYEERVENIVERHVLLHQAAAVHAERYLKVMEEKKMMKRAVS